MLQVPGVLRFNVSASFPPNASELPSIFLPLYPLDRNPFTYQLYIYRCNKFQVRFQTVGARRQTWNSHARAGIALLLYRGLVNKLNQIRSALSGNRCCLRLLASLLALFPAAILLFYGEGRGEKIAAIESKRGRGGQTEVQRARGHCASSSRVGLLVSFLLLESQASFDPRVNNSDWTCYPVCDDGYCLYLWILFLLWKRLIRPFFKKRIYK